MENKVLVILAEVGEEPTSLDYLCITWAGNRTFSLAQSPFVGERVMSSADIP